MENVSEKENERGAMTCLSFLFAFLLTTACVCAVMKIC